MHCGLFFGKVCCVYKRFIYKLFLSHYRTPRVIITQNVNVLKILLLFFFDLFVKYETKEYHKDGLEKVKHDTTNFHSPKQNTCRSKGVFCIVLVLTVTNTVDVLILF